MGVTSSQSARAAWVLVIVGLIGACDGSPPQPPARAAKVTPSASFVLPEPPGLGDMMALRSPTPAGALGVRALLVDGARYDSQRLLVTGVVRAVSPDCASKTRPPPPPEPATPPRRRPPAPRATPEPEPGPLPRPRHEDCAAPLMVILSDGERGHALLPVEGYHPYLHPFLREGMELTVHGRRDPTTGRFTTTSKAAWVRACEAQPPEGAEPCFAFNIGPEGRFFGDVARVIALRDR